jgi:hypothetical protein
VNLQLFGHPFSSYTWKVLIALWADETPFKFRMLGPDHPENGDERVMFRTPSLSRTRGISHLRHILLALLVDVAYDRLCSFIDVDVLDADEL